MNARERLVLHGLTLALAERFSKRGHTMQFVTEESRGYCTVKGCAPSCVALTQLLRDAVALLEEEAAAMECEQMAAPVRGTLGAAG